MRDSEVRPVPGSNTISPQILQGHAEAVTFRIPFHMVSSNKSTALDVIFPSSLSFDRCQMIVACCTRLMNSPHPLIFEHTRGSC